MVRKINPYIYEPMERNFGRAKSKGEKHFKRYLRGCGDNYIKRPEVREFVFSKDGYKCVDCGEKEHLQVDHIISVYRVFKDGVDIKEVNKLDNLQTLCRSCNSRKKP
jgi:5-methylcytosine-specific restriction endonuclease McrA